MQPTLLSIARSPRARRRFGALRRALLAVVWIALAAPAVHAGGLATLPPRAGAELAQLARGASEWVRVRIAEVGLATDADVALASELPVQRSRALPPAETLKRLATQSGVERVWVLDLDADRGRALVQIAMVETASSALVGAGRAEAPLAELGGALAEATDALLVQCGATGRTLQAPTLAELATYGRALAELDAGHPADAWRQLAARKSATADALRARIEALDSSETLAIGERARLAIAKGDAETARLWLRSQLVLNPNDPVLALAAAEQADELGEAERAVPLYDRALELDPASTVARQGRARVLLKLGRADEAMAAIADQADVDPLVAESAADAESLDAATRARLHLQVGHEWAARMDAGRALEHIDRARQLDATLQGQSEREAALLHAKLGEPEKALPFAERAFEMGAADAPLLQALGEARHAAGDGAGARQAYEQAHALAPEDAAPLRGLGEIAMEAGDQAQAQQLFTKALDLAPEQDRARLMLAGILRVTGQADTALQVLEGRPGGPTAELLREGAAIQAAKGNVDGATGMLEQAMELAPANPGLAEDLAKLREAAGDAAGATQLRQQAQQQGSAAKTAEELAPSETQLPTPSGLRELATSFPSRMAGREEPVQVVALLAASLEHEPHFLARLLPRQTALDAVDAAVARALGESFEVVAPHEIPNELAHAEQDALRAFQGDEAAVARMNDALGTDAVFVVHVRAAEAEDERPGALRLEVRMLVGNDPEQVRRFANQTWISDAADFVEWNPSAIVVYSLALVLALLPLLRGWGHLQVSMQYASLGKGFFSIKLSRRSAKVAVGEQRTTAGTHRYLRRMRLMGRFERSMVGKETLFRWLPARRYFVTVHGLLQDANTGEVVGNYAAEQTLVIERGKIAKLDFDFRSREASLEICVFRANEPVEQATVALRGKPDSLRYAHAGRTMFYLSPGTYRVLVGLDGCVAEREVSIEGFAARSLSLDMQDQNAWIFGGCPEAVEPYLVGNLEEAAEALERAGEETAAANVRGEHYAAIGDVERASKALQRAGRYEDAAGLLSRDSDPATAAQLYERAGNHEKAAQSYELAEDFERAAHHYEAAYRYEEACEAYRRVGNLDKVCELLEKLARFYEAARMAIDAGDPDRAIRDLQMVELRDIDYVRACQLLGQIFGERGEYELALQKLDEAVTVGGGENAPLEMVEQLARAREQAGRLEQALEAWESIRARDFHYPEASVKIDALKRMIAVDRETRATISNDGGTPSGESRYEILGEIGRGGMGVVFKARDKRLGRVVALKRLPDNLRNHPTAVRLFLREARAAAALNHRNIVTLFDAGQEGDQYFLTMELLEGLPLHDILTRRGKLSPRDAARLGAQAAAGLEYAHASGVVHRDIKTSNLFFTKDRVLKIMDFGLAKMTEEVRRAATVVGGTPYYMAPEQAAGEDVDHRADQYALGVTLFELVTGDVPFKEGDVTYHHRHTAPPDPTVAASDLPEDFRDVILKLMAKRREDRFERTADAGTLLNRIAKRLTA